ncbi:putative 4-hydroxybenzoate polyprenyltransferase [Desulfovibrio sp. OttesenSCG-928-G11]|nr:putative 4-hydroxybenzoate polyprenyltransferase [Desulfovibrio sp. OttesenSCG-928-G11]
MNCISRFGAICRMIKIEHSIFALPFAYAGSFMAARGWPGFAELLLLTLAMVGIRSFAMGVNRIADLPFDRQNPRTSAWPLVTGEISTWQTWRFCALMAALFVVACAALNPLCLALSPVALVMAALYSYTKRFTWLCHFALGAVIGLAPIAGWLAVQPSFDMTQLLLAFGVLFWIAGFDILYSCQDLAFDQQQGLHSLPARFGLEAAAVASALSHVNTVLFLFLAGLAGSLAFGWHLALAVTAVLLWWQHRVVRPQDLVSVRKTFAMNAPISVLLFVGTLLGVLF